MRKALKFCLPAFAGLLNTVIDLPAGAHVKWFLTENAEALMAKPKPELFTHWSPLLEVVLALFALFLAAAILSSRLHGRASLHNSILKFGLAVEPFTHFAIFSLTGLFLMQASLSGYFLAPNFPFCEHCPWWLPTAQFAGGMLLVLLRGSMPAVAALCLLLSFPFTRHTLLECLNLLPLFGIAFYLFVVADARLASRRFVFEQEESWSSLKLAHQGLRVLTGLGLIVLGMDEKILHPQLAMNILHQVPALNFMSRFGMGDDLFVLCSGLFEIGLGTLIMLGCWPRLGALALSGVFALTTLIFGPTEALGHMPLYGIGLSILLFGSASPQTEEAAVVDEADEPEPGLRERELVLERSDSGRHRLVEGAILH